MKIISWLEAKSATGLFITWFVALVLLILDWQTLLLPTLVSNGIVIIGIAAFIMQAVPIIILRYQLPKELPTLNRGEAHYLLESVQTKTKTQNHRLNNSVTISLEGKGFLIRKNVKESVKMVPCTIQHIAWHVITRKKHKRILEKRVAETVIPELKVEES